MDKEKAPSQDEFRKLVRVNEYLMREVKRLKGIHEEDRRRRSKSGSKSS